MPDYRVTESTLTEVQALLKQDQEDLYALLGLQIQGIDKPPSEVRIRERAEMIRFDFLVSEGESFFDKIVPTLKKIICVDGKYCEKKSDFEANIKKLLEWLVEAIVAAGVITIPIFGGITIPAAAVITIAALIIKYGLDTLCAC